MAAPALQEAGAEEVLKPTAKPLAGYLSRDLHGHKRRVWPDAAACNAHILSARH